MIRVVGVVGLCQRTLSSRGNQGREVVGMEIVIELFEMIRIVGGVGFFGMTKAVVLVGVI